ncbi:DNA polymerase beta-like protein [Neohortaea acidophila]|uniref:DNA polymerase n=1 Tax=Neohortaea acidophila TaxID=245834 RepID=A0A6A6Q4I0_9PEZI|nr:DNA polymerase beta-like protein [Neohortaea acidophila]KAF2486929.1 DNA polymerase beta-like protein [Neohortaea acidophila]
MSRADSSDTAKGPPPLVTTSSSAVTKKAVGKRKRDSEIRLVPDDQRIFKSQRFYFFPNSDKHPARKLRIAKAIEFGATWESEFNESVTHIVADKSMDYGLLLKYLKKDALPPHIALVSENYPAECITFCRLLDPRQPQFKVRGYDLSAAAPPISSASSDRSLKLKPAPDSVRARQPETPVQDDRVPESPPTVSTEDGEGEEDRNPSAPPIESTAEFDAALKQARDLRHVPLDMEEDSGSRPTSSDGPATDDERPPAGSELDRRKKGKAQNYQAKFQCMHKHTGSDENPNVGTIAILQQMAEYYNQVGDEWRTRAYRKAISTLRNHPTKVWTREEALALPQIGGRLASKIEEIAYTNRLRRLDNAKAEPQDQVLQTFMQVYGAGFAQASKWVNAGYTTLDELVEKAELTPNQRIGIDHYADFNSRIPRAEVEQHGNAVRKALHKIDPAFDVIVGGSYRRGAKDSGDIDCIITRPNTDLPHIRQVVLDQLVPKLFAKRFLMAELAATSRDDGSKWHGASCIAGSSSSTGIWRRIDLLLVPSDELGAALIYFTGNDIFNRSLRLLASTKGMRLNQRGLYKDVIRGKGREKLSEGTLVEGRDEKRIFEVLGVPWRPPEHRIC